MLRGPAARNLRAVLLATCLLVGSAAILVAPGATLAHAISRPGPSTLPTTPFTSGSPWGTTGPDDLAFLPGECSDGTPSTIWTAYQNGIGPTGNPGVPGGPTQSTLVGYDLSTGKVVRAINISGHLDGLVADAGHGRLLATANEDANSSLVVVDPYTGAVARFAFSPSPTTGGNGGTDSLAIWHGGLYVSHSNPNDTSQPASYSVTLDWSTLTARLSPLFWADSSARSAIGGGAFSLALTDPDTNLVMPSASPRFAGDLATVSQGDGKIVFARTPSVHHPGLTVVNVTDNVSGNVPPIDGLAVATASEGTLYVVDAKAGTISALVTDGWSLGTIFVTEPSDNGNPLLGTLNPWTGAITPLGNPYLSPKGLLFVPEHHGQETPGCSDVPGFGNHPHGPSGDHGPRDGGPTFAPRLPVREEPYGAGAEPGAALTR